MRRVVILTPTVGDLEKNLRYALWCAHDCYFRGEAPYLGYLTHALHLDLNIEAERMHALQTDYDWAAQADAFIFYLDLSWTVDMERAKNRWSGRKIEHRQLPADMLSQFEQGVHPGCLRFEPDG